MCKRLVLIIHCTPDLTRTIERCRILSKGSVEMKKSKSIFGGIFSLLFYYLVMHLMLLWEYDEKYSFIQNAMLYVLPALPGVALAILLIRNSVRGFFKSWGICFLTSVCFGFLWIILMLFYMYFLWKIENFIILTIYGKMPK